MQNNAPQGNSNFHNIGAPQEISVFHMVGYLGTGLKLALSKECRLFVIIPIIINFVVLAFGGYLVFQTISTFLQQYLDSLLALSSVISSPPSLLSLLHLSMAF